MLVGKGSVLKSSFVRKDLVQSDEAEKKFMEEKKSSFYGKDMEVEPKEAEKPPGIDDLLELYNYLVTRQKETKVRGD